VLSDERLVGADRKGIGTVRHVAIPGSTPFV